MALLQDYIKEYIPVHELPRVECKILVDKVTGDETRDVELRSEDLFLISKLSSACTEQNEAIMVSKALTYGFLSERLSADFDIYKMQQDIAVLSNDVCCISLDLSALSTWTIYRFDTLSDNYILRYGKKNYHIPNGVVLQDFALSDGQFVESSLTGYPISDYIIAYEATHPTVGVLLGDTWSEPETQTLADSETTEFVYTVSEDSHVRVDLSVLEQDTTDKPLEIYLSSVALEDDELTPIPDQTVSMKVAHFNNPGGYPGVKYYNFYSIGIPAKSIVSRSDQEITDRYTKIVIRYQDGSPFLYDENNPTVVSFTPFKFHGTASKNDLLGFVPADSSAHACTEFGIYKCMINENGLVTGAELADNSDFTEAIGIASATQAGVVQVGRAKDGSEHPVEIDSTGKAYVDIPITGNGPGLIQTDGTNNYAAENQVKIALKREGSVGYSYIPYAGNGQYGVVKTGSSMTRGNVFINDDGNMAVQFGEDLDWIDFLSAGLSDFVFEQLKPSLSNMVVQEFKNGIYDAIKTEISGMVIQELSAEIYEQVKNQLQIDELI